MWVSANGLFKGFLLWTFKGMEGSLVFGSLGCCLLFVEDFFSSVSVSFCVPSSHQYIVFSSEKKFIKIVLDNFPFYLLSASF